MMCTHFMAATSRYTAAKIFDCYAEMRPWNRSHGIGSHCSVLTAESVPSSQACLFCE